MQPKYLRPYRERLIWISVFLSTLCVFSLIVMVATHSLYPAYSFEYIIRQKTIVWFYFLIFATLISFGINLYFGWLGRHIVESGICYTGQITKVYWHRAFLSGSEWKCRLAINCNNGKEYITPYYRYDLLNYLYDTRCELYILGKHCYVTGFQTMDRIMTKEEKKAGIYGGSAPHNTIPKFPFLNLVEFEACYRKNHSYRSTSQCVLLGVICLLLTLRIAAFSMQVYEPSRGDSDHDGAPDYIEFELGTDPLVADAVFQITDTDESTRSNVTLNVAAPYYKEMLSDAFINYSMLMLNEETMVGYVDRAFTFRLPQGCTEATILVEFHERLLENETFYPKLYKFSYDYQEQGLVELPSHWDGSSNHITWDCTEESKASTEIWRYYLLDKTSVDEWKNSYWANAT